MSNMKLNKIKFVIIEEQRYLVEIPDVRKSHGPWSRICSQRKWECSVVSMSNSGVTVFWVVQQQNIRGRSMGNKSLSTKKKKQKNQLITSIYSMDSNSSFSLSLETLWNSHHVEALYDAFQKTSTTIQMDNYLEMQTHPLIFSWPEQRWCG